MTDSCKRKRDQGTLSVEPNTVLLEAADTCNVRAINTALAAGADIAAVGPHGCNALQLAASKGHVHAIFALVLAGADHSAGQQGEPRTTPLALAVCGGHHQAVHALLAAGALPVTEALVAAARSLEFSILRTLLAAGGQPSQDCLCAAAEADDFNMVQLLVQAGVAVGGCGAVALAAEANNVAMVQLLLAHGAHPDEYFGDLPGLVIAAIDGNDDVMRLLLAAGADVEIEPLTDEFSRPLAECNYADAARVALAAGAMLQDPAQGYVALVHLAGRARPEVLSVLLEAGAAVDAADASGMTALHAAAASEGRARAVHQLLAAGASVSARDLFGETALHMAARQGGLDDLYGVTPHSAEVVQLLLAAGAAAAAADSTGNTPLHVAASVPVIEALVAAGAPLEAVNAAGQTPLLAALQRGEEECALALLAAGAVIPRDAMTLALRRPFNCGPWLTALLPASRSISPQQLADWVEARFCKPPTVIRPVFGPAEQPAKQQLVWQVWALRSRLPPELLRLVAAMCCILP